MDRGGDTLDQLQMLRRPLWLAVSIVIAVALAAACSNGSQGAGSNWTCRQSSAGFCYCAASNNTADRTVGTCNLQSVSNGICSVSNGTCTCSSLGCTPPRDPSSNSAGLVCDCATIGIGSTESASIQSCTAPAGGICCLGLNLANCSCQADSSTGCGNAMTVPSCDVSAVRGAWPPTMGRQVDDCSSPPESG